MQSDFDDLYTGVYALIDEAKAAHSVLKAHKGSHGAADPHPLVSQVGSWVFAEGRGLLAFCCSAVGKVGPVELDQLDHFDSSHEPRVSTVSVFARVAQQCNRRPDRELLAEVAARRHAFGRYRGGSTAYDDEARAVAVEHFRSLGHTRVVPGEVMLTCGGAKGSFMAACGAVMCRHESEQVHRMSGRVLAPAGHYQSLRVVPPVFGGCIEVTRSLDGGQVAAWLDDTRDLAGRVLYVPLVNNVDGLVLGEDRARRIAAAVLEHNRRNPVNPVVAIGDDVYGGSYLDTSIRPTPIGAVTGSDLGMPDLGDMADWTVSVVSPSKTVALPTSRIAAAYTTNPTLRAGLEHYRTMLSLGRLPPAEELTAAAAWALTPNSWIARWNAIYRARTAWLADRLDEINADLGMQAYRLEPPQGGWYAALRIHPRLVGDPRVRTSVDMAALCLHYAPHEHESGIAVLPGELSGYHTSAADPEFTLRVSVAVAEPDLAEIVARLRGLGAALCAPNAPEVITHALGRARACLPASTAISP